MSSGSNCSYSAQLAGTCNYKTENTGSELVLSGTETRRSGESDSGSRSAQRDKESTSSRVSTGTSRTPERPPLQGSGALGAECGGRVNSDAGVCVAAASPPSGGAFADRVVLDMTISDVARFAPSAPTAQMEPFGQAVVGFPANVFATDGTHTTSGTLLGQSVRVRFTPVTYVFDYGDGTVATTITPGASWAALGQADFTETATSHVYTSRGTFTVRLDVHYRAEVDFGAGWADVSGEMTTTRIVGDIIVHAVRTALVAHTCDEVPSAAGCG